MGRPLRKDVRGTDVIGTPVGSNAGIRVAGYFGGSLATNYYIVKQRGSRTYVVTNDGVNYHVGVLVQGTPSVDGEIRMQGSVTGLMDQNLVSLAKLTKHLAIDFSGNRYTWFLENDSSGDYIDLTAI